jgi:hypothetical protein
MLNDARASLELAPRSCPVVRPTGLLLIAKSADSDFARDVLPEIFGTSDRSLIPRSGRSLGALPWALGPNRPRVLISFSATEQYQMDALQRTINVWDGSRWIRFEWGPPLIRRPFRRRTTPGSWREPRMIRCEVSLVTHRGPRHGETFARAWSAGPGYAVRSR